MGRPSTGGSAPGCAKGSSQSCYTGPAGTKDVGPCQAGTQDCQDGQWGPCEGEVTPVTEVCDSADNDCDGQLDNGGDALCANDGQGHACVKGTPSSFCGCFDDNDCPQGRMCCGCGSSGFLTICGDIQDGQCVCP